MKFMQHICFYTLITYIYLVSTDQLIIIIYTIFKLWESWGFLENRTIFWWRHFRSGWRHQVLIFYGMKGLGLNFKEKNTVIQSDVPGGPHIFPKWPYFSIFVIEKIVKNELFGDIQQLFPTKSISQNPMVISDFWYLELGTFVILNMLAPNPNYTRNAPKFHQITFERLMFVEH